VDTFEALVRLDAAGWTTLPARPDLASADVPPELSRLLKRAGGLSHAGRHYDFAGAGEPPSDVVVVGGFVRRLGDDALLVAHDDTLRVFGLGPEGDLVVLATSVGDWLATLLTPPEPEDVGPEPLADLAFDGEGHGWDLDAVPVPATLRRDLLPTDLLDAPLHVDARCAWVGDRIVEVAPAPRAVVEEALGATGPDLDELFGAGGGRPRPRSTVIVVLVVLGLVLTILGMACIAVPGGLLVLLAWMLVEKDVDRLRSGYLPDADREVVERVRSMTYAALLLVVVLFGLQAFLLCNGFYDVLLDGLYIPWWRSLFVVEDPDAALSIGLRWVVQSVAQVT
jgi:hypothetical protein